MLTSNNYTHEQGIVVKKSSGIYHVRSNEHITICALSPRLRKELIYPIADPTSLSHIVREVKVLDKSDPLAVGDMVRYLDTQDGGGLIYERLPRRNRLSRRDPYPGNKKFEQVLVANVDMVLPVFAAANPTPKWGMLDRYLVSAESLGLQSLIVISKTDLVRKANGSLDEEIDQMVDVYRRIGYPVLLTSSVSGEGLGELKARLNGHLSVFVGKSGVGKTALLNALEPGLDLRTGEVGGGRVGKGRHTTSGVEMVAMSKGGFIVDTPGVREFGLIETEDQDLAACFPEMRPFVGKCRFRLDCRHNEEPGCAIRKAVMDGEVSPLRYQSYLRLIIET